MSKEDDKEKLIDASHIPVEKVYRYIDVIVPVIGLGIIFITSISLLFEKELAPEFLLGATLSSFFLALSESFLIGEKIKKFTMRFYGFLFLSGVVSVIFLPHVLNMFPQLLNKFKTLSEPLTLIALGFVMVVIGLKSLSYRRKAIDSIYNEFKDISENTDKVIKDIEANQEEAKNLRLTFEAERKEFSEKIEDITIKMEEMETLKVENERLTQEMLELKRN